MFRFWMLFILFFSSHFSFAEDSKTYVGGTLFASHFHQRNFYYWGWNQDSHCYADMNNCPSAITGFAWLYDIDSIWAPGLSLEGGIYFDKWRLEISLDGVYNPKVSFSALGSYYLTGDSKERPFPPFSLKDSFFETIDSKDLTGSLTKTEGEEIEGSSSSSSISSFNLNTAFVNAYYNIPFSWEGYHPYVGAGLGFASLSVRLKYESSYPADQTQNDALQDTVFNGSSLAGRLILGVDKTFSDKITYGVKANYSFLFKELSDILPYEFHLNQFNSQALIQGIKYWTLGFNVKYFLK